MRATWIPESNAREALERAATIVDLSECGPEAALRLATWGVPLLVDADSGSAELIEDVYTFDRARSGSLLAAVTAAATTPAIGVSSVIKPKAPALPTEGPLVSLMIPTFNKPGTLREALESVQAQQYTNVEVIVVNDAGEPVDDVVADFRFARLVNMTENHPGRAWNAGYYATHGEYFGVLCDDDTLFPDHVSRLVEALDRTGAELAYADVLTVFLRGASPNWEAYGIDSLMNHVVDLDTLLVTNQIGTNSALLKRTILEQDGWLVDEGVPFSRDYALWLRLATRYDFVHVERITSCYTIRNSGQDQVSVRWSNRTLAAFEAIYKRFPVERRPVLQSRRAARLQEIGRVGSGLVTQPALEFSPAIPWPLNPSPRSSA
jgi:hypothetical protein